MNALFLGVMAIASATLSAAAAENPLAATFDLLSATRDRPLFAPTRRPPPPPPPPVAERVAPPAPIPLPNVALIGVVTDPEKGGWVLVRGSDAKIVRARIGELIDGWQLSEIEPRGVVLSNNDRSVNLGLFAARKNDRTASTNK